VEVIRDMIAKRTKPVAQVDDARYGRRPYRLSEQSEVVQQCRVGVTHGLNGGSFHWFANPPSQAVPLHFVAMPLANADPFCATPTNYARRKAFPRWLRDCY
jgi:hypothetical protein